MATYLNRPDVQAALHVNASGQLPGPWADCSPNVKYHRWARDHVVNGIQLQLSLGTSLNFVAPLCTLQRLLDNCNGSGAVSASMRQAVLKLTIALDSKTDTTFALCQGQMCAIYVT